MITIFNGRTRGVGEGGRRIFIQVDVALRDHLHVFKNGKDANALSVFMAIALHADANGWAFPSTETLMASCGFERRETISRALEHLRNVRINGKRLLAHYRVRRANGTWGASYYLIFPDEGFEAYPSLQKGERLEEVATETPDQPCAEKPCTVEPCMVEAGIAHIYEVEPSFEGDSQRVKTRCSAQPDSPAQVAEQKAKADTSTPLAQAVPEGDVATNASKPPEKAQKTPFKRAELNALMECIAQHIFEAPSAICAPQIAVLLHGSKSGKRRGLLAYEAERQGVAPESATLCADIAAFAKWWRANHVKDGVALSVPRGDAFLVHWHQWRQKTASAPSAAQVCALCGGTRLAFAVPQDTDADGNRLWRIGGRDLAQAAEARTIKCPCCGSNPKPYEYVTGRLHRIDLS